MAVVVGLRQRQQINHELKKLGFGGLDDPHLFAQIGTLYTIHDGFRGLLMSVAPEQRRLAYESIRPHLRFIAKPLDLYEREIKERAEREQWDVWDGTAYPKPFKPGEVETDEYRLQRLAQDAIQQTEHEKAKGVLELVCTKCTIIGQFPGEKRKDATKKAHDTGWRWDERNGLKRTYCPDHVPGRATMKLECSVEGCNQMTRLRVWDEQDGYRAARNLGWIIGDAAQCPRCAMKAVTVQ